MEQWREKGQTPMSMAAKNEKSGLSRPLCPYPQYAKYSGTGDLKDAANWSCTAP
jgi:feruloyl esterase